MKKRLIEFLAGIPVVSDLMIAFFRFRAYSFFLIYRKNNEVFHQIYKRNRWGDKESVSGPGSTLEYTANIRKELPRLFDSLGIQSILDAPCGDFNWFRLVQQETGIRYTGGDIVPDLVARNQAAFGNDRTSFMVLDITSDPLPEADLWLCRDCLFHLRNKDIAKALNNFKNGPIRYLLTSTYPESPQNTDIPAGSFRYLNLALPPFSLCKPLLVIEDWIPGTPVRHLALWEKSMLK